MSNSPSGFLGRSLTIGNRIKSWFGALSRPARILLFSTAALCVVFASFFGYRETHEPYAILFAQLEQEDAGAIVVKLKELNVPYRLGPGGSTIEVAESRVGDLRLELAGAGLPRGGGVGFESFDKMRLGATEFEQRVLYRRALEGELSRTIGTLAAVQSSRIHLVLPEKSVFVARTELASASIVLRLRPGRTLGPSEVSGIVHLTAASVSGLTADRVALVTTDGEMLHKPRATVEGSAQVEEEDQGSRQHAIEAQLEEHARLMLEKVVGPGHADVRVSAELDMARVERVEDRYDPTRTVLRSEETSVERSGSGLDDNVAGVPGAESNLPTGVAPAVPAALAALSLAAKGDAGAPKLMATTAKGAAELPFRESHTRNYEVDHVSEKRVLDRGALKRVAVAVILDGVPRTVDGKTILVPRDRAELDKLGALVRGAVGANDARGDSVTIDSMLFDDAKAVVELPPDVPTSSLPRTWRAYAPAGGAAAALAIAMIVAVARRRRKRIAAGVAQLVAPAALAQQLGAAKPGDARAAAIERAAADPATAALVLRAWLGTSTDTEPQTVSVRN